MIWNLEPRIKLKKEKDNYNNNKALTVAFNLASARLSNTVKPVYNNHPLDLKKVAVA